MSRFELTKDAAALALRIDGESTLMQIVAGGWMPPARASRLLAELVRDGVAKLR